MALNWTMLKPDRSPVPLPHELFIRTIESGAELTVSIPNAPPSASSTSGGSGGEKQLKELGRLWLTDQRLIFVANVPAKGTASFESTSIPLTAILSTKFEQPFFGQNYLAVDIKPAAEGGLTEGTKVEVRLFDKGLFEFVSILEKTRERAIYMKRQMADEEEGLPGYTSPATGPSGPSGSTPMPDEAPPGYDAPSYTP
ncbi:hypothetical protein PHLCEN_2v7965 [Hermanssonia centrifuga]|uniref:Uncharacterized protein n=1 Tax=Hermanssonia centrifuga TaxID=98765 RepID=A0A2R6NUZ4_9APHY|nr:hypothetical protein PHLCEN_2v7965 [Hermanssonia centrifuga]